MEFSYYNTLEDAKDCAHILRQIRLGDRIGEVIIPLIIWPCVMIISAFVTLRMDNLKTILTVIVTTIVYTFLMFWGIRILKNIAQIFALRKYKNLYFGKDGKTLHQNLYLSNDCITITPIYTQTDSSRTTSSTIINLNEIKKVIEKKNKLFLISKKNTVFIVIPVDVFKNQIEKENFINKLNLK